MIEQKECRLEVAMCHRMRQNPEDIPVNMAYNKRVDQDLVCLSEGVYAVIPEMAPQICQIFSMGHLSMSFVYFSHTALDLGMRSSAEIVVKDGGFLADHLPFEVVADVLMESGGAGKMGKRLCKVRFLSLNDISRKQIDHVIFMKEIGDLQ